MKGIKGKKLSKWKSIIITDINTGEVKQFELNEDERLIDKIKPDRRKHLPRKYIKIRFTEDHVQKRKKLDKILNLIISQYDKKNKKKMLSISQNNDEHSIPTQQHTSEENIGSSLKDLCDKLFFDSDESNIFNENDLISFDELDLNNF